MIEEEGTDRSRAGRAVEADQGDQGMDAKSLRMRMEIFEKDDQSIGG